MYLHFSIIYKAMSHAAMLKQVVRQSLSDIDQEALLQQVIDGTSEGMYSNCLYIMYMHGLGTITLCSCVLFSRENPSQSQWDRFKSQKLDILTPIQRSSSVIMVTKYDKAA